jgi:glycosyltransferase involved in cell wall biosynthesis
MKKILVITNIPNPYRIPLFAELNRQLANEGMSLKVVFAAMGYKRRMYKIDLANCGFDFEILQSGVYTAEENSEVTYFDYKGLLDLVKKEQPYRCIIAGFSSGTMQLFFRSFFTPTPFIIWSGSISKKGRNDNMLRKIQRNIIALRASAFVAYGNKAKQYLIENLGVNPDKIAIARNTIDTAFFSSETDKIRTTSGQEKKKHFLYIGYLVPRKNIKLLLLAVEKISKTRNDFVLDIVGDGESRQELENFIKDHQLSEFIQMHGFRQKEELPTFLAQATAFLFQTDFDIWGLTLNESMAAGLPCLCSVNAGAATDLVIEGETGWIVDYRNTGQVTEKLNYILDHPEEAQRMGKNAKLKIESTATLALSAAGFIEAIKISETKKR